jgi:adenylate cyclase
MNGAKLREHWQRERARAVMTVLAAIIVAAVGWGVNFFSIGDPLARLSYDTPQIVYSENAKDLCIVYLDEQSARTLRQPLDVWDRAIHARLIQRLTAAGARGIFFDIVFADNGEGETSSDVELSKAIAEGVPVFLGAALEVESESGVDQESVIRPSAAFRKAGGRWGLLTFRPVDPDYGVRRIYCGTSQAPTMTWNGAVHFGGDLPRNPEDAIRERWVHYYDEGSFPAVSIDRALDPELTPAEMFRDRYVFVGARSTLGRIGSERDAFTTPHTRLNGRFAPGVEVHATIFLNLLQQSWLTRLAPRTEDAGLILVGLFLGGFFARLRPLGATIAGGVFVLLITAAAIWLLVAHRIWGNWTVAAFVQVPIALGLSLASNFFLEERRRSVLKKAFGHYLSPEMADRIADSRLDLKPGGELVEASIIFTDLQGFTKLSEELGDPQRLSQVLVAYFNNTTRHVLENEGTIIKYIGDAVLAVWGTPLPDANHAERAVLAAWRMHEASQIEVMGHQLVTRVGVNTGVVLAGNLGSDFRFDFTVIGDAVNFASRLESLNKYFGTRVLISDETAGRLGPRFSTRPIGRFVVVGKKQSVAIYELLGVDDPGPTQSWRTKFQQGLDAFSCGNLELAGSLMREVGEAREGEDGVAQYYLKKIGDLRQQGLPQNWDGVIEFDTK